MKDELLAAKQRIREAARVWKKLTPPGVTIHLIFIEGDVDTESPTVICETKTAWEYHQAAQRWSLTNAAGLSQDEIDATYVHEVMHVYLGVIEAHLRSDDEHAHWVNSVCEHTVESLALAFLRLVP